MIEFNLTREHRSFFVGLPDRAMFALSGLAFN